MSKAPLMPADAPLSWRRTTASRRLDSWEGGDPMESHMHLDRGRLESTSAHWRAVCTAALGFATLAVFGAFFLLPSVRSAFPDGGGAAAFAKFQLASSAEQVREVFGDPVNPAIVAAVDAVDRLDLFVFIPVYGV